MLRNTLHLRKCAKIFVVALYGKSPHLFLRCIDFFFKISQNRTIFSQSANERGGVDSIKGQLFKAGGRKTQLKTRATFIYTHPSAKIAVFYIVLGKMQFSIKPVPLLFYANRS